jgi:hypothetical protein
MSSMPRRRPLHPLLSRDPKREPYDVVLIVCEGQKTEPLYLRRLRQIHRLSSANIDIVSSPGQDPLSIVAHAEGRMNTEDFNRVFCVFDRDGHAGYDQALRRIRELKDAGKDISAITSWPCFEIWLLLHFVYTARPFQRVQNTSACDGVIRELRRHIPNYDKGLDGLYDNLLVHQQRAIAHAARLARENKDTGSVNPATNMHDLVAYLLGIKGT